MPNYKPIETEYNGYRFRSRLEARWAVFFDAMDIRYEYEYDGYESYGYYYLPDFWLPDYKIHAEVKGATCRGQIPKEDAEKMSWMIDYGGPCSNGIILLGNLPDPAHAEDLNWALWKWDGKGMEYGWLMFSERPDPESYFDCYDVQSAPHYFNKNDDIVLTHANYPCYWNGKPAVHDTRIELALRKARQARFEHGETPTI